MKHITVENFESEVLKSNVPVLVDFAAVWCGPCKMMGPVIEEIELEFKDKVKVCKLDIDESAQLAQQYKVMAVPTIMFFNNGEIKDKIVGVVPKIEIEDKIKEFV